MKFGIELEFTAAVAHANSPQYGNFYEHVLGLMHESGIHNWRYEADASCGNEIVSPILEGETGLNQALQACECAQTAQKQYELGRLLGPDCGVHFHFDATDLVERSSHNVVAIRNVLLLAAILEPLWFSMNPGARFETAFAAPLNFNMFQMIRARDMVDIRDIWFRDYMGVKGHGDSYRIQHNSYSPTFVNSDRRPDKYDWTRYHGLNLVALWKHGSFEFRYTHGTFDPYNVEMWFRFYQKIVELSRKTKTNFIIRACPYNINSIKSGSIKGLQDMLYRDLNLILRYLFEPWSKHSQPLLEPDPKLLHFILKKLVKYNHATFPHANAKRIWNDDGTNFHRLMGYVRDLRIQSAHARRNRFRFTPQPMSHPTNEPPFPEDEMLDGPNHY